MHKHLKKKRQRKREMCELNYPYLNSSGVSSSRVACVQTITKLRLVPEFNFVCAQATSRAAVA